MPRRIADLVRLQAVSRDPARVLPLLAVVRDSPPTAAGVAAEEVVAVVLEEVAAVEEDAVVEAAVALAAGVAAANTASAVRAGPAVPRNSETTGGVNRPFTD